jgi:adenosylcobinamide kinase / adenosylcobinamide-phosphate guanylyltransferase
MTLTLLLGGARSGKSALAVHRAATLGQPVVFVATAEARDAEMRARIARHQAERPAGWTTLEVPHELCAAIERAPAEATLIIDCLTLWVANLIERGDDQVAVEATANRVARQAAHHPGAVITVSNEVGMGVVPDHPLGRVYRDQLGRVNAIWARHATDALLVVAGRTLALQPTGPTGA